MYNILLKVIVYNVIIEVLGQNTSDILSLFYLYQKTNSSSKILGFSLHTFIPIEHNSKK